MARVFITGSADGLGLMSGEWLVKHGHEVVLHARSESRAAEARKRLPAANAVVVGDFASIAEMKKAAAQANDAGPFDAVIHNVGIGYHRGKREETVDRLEAHFAVNVLSYYVLTALVPAKRLVYLSSGMHSGGTPNLDDPQWTKRRWAGSSAYSDTKLFDVVLAFAIARRWPHVLANAVTPGWVATKMGGAGAPDDLAKGAITQAWLAVSDDAAAKVTGTYFYHQKPERAHAAGNDAKLQDALLAYCEKASGVSLPDK